MILDESMFDMSSHELPTKVLNIICYNLFSCTGLQLVNWQRVDEPNTKDIPILLLYSLIPCSGTRN